MPVWARKFLRRLGALTPGRYRIILDIDENEIRWTVEKIGKIEKVNKIES
jgi:hypothetical protein